MDWQVIAALSYPHRIIGRQGRLPWHLPLELQLFRHRTWGGILVIGRRTWESLQRPLPGRELWILSRTLTLNLPTVQVFSTPEALLSGLVEIRRPVFFAGGAEIYRWALSLPQVKTLWITWVYAPDLTQGDTFFPSFENHWQVVAWEFFVDGCVPFVQVLYRRREPFTNE